MSLPSSDVQRKKLLGYVNQSVVLMEEVDVLKEDIKNIGIMTKEELGIPSKEFNLLVKVAYDKSKVEDEIEQRQTAISEVEILNGSV